MKEIRKEILIKEFFEEEEEEKFFFEEEEEEEFVFKEDEFLKKFSTPVENFKIYKEEYISLYNKKRKIYLDEECEAYDFETPSYKKLGFTGFMGDGNHPGIGYLCTKKEFIHDKNMNENLLYEGECLYYQAF